MKASSLTLTGSYETRFSSDRLRVDADLVLDVPHTHSIVPGNAECDRHSYALSPTAWQNSFARLLSRENQGPIEQILAAMPEQDRNHARRGLANLTVITPKEAEFGKTQMWVCDYVVEELKPLLYAIQDSELAHGHPQLKPLAEALLIRNTGRQAAMWGFAALAAIIIGGSIWVVKTSDGQKTQPQPTPQKQTAPEPAPIKGKQGSTQLGMEEIAVRSSLALARGR